MATEHVLRLRRTDAEGEYLLVNISQSGSKPLDLKLVASENEHIYPATIKESHIKSLQDSKCKGSLDDWKTLLKFALLQERPSGPLPTDLQGLETVASISASTVTITLRKNFSGVIQRQGTIKLEQDDEEAIDFFSTTCTAVARAEDLSEQLDTLQASVSTQQEQVAKLNKQLDDLVKAKKEHEEELLKKFAALLNAKKLKIRDQQRLLAGAKLDPQAAENVSKARDGDGESRKAGGSRKGKRKANGAPEPELKSEEVADQDDVATEDDDDDLDRRQETPERDETEDEGDEEGFEAPPAPTQRAQGGSKGKAPEAAAGKARSGGDAMEVEENGVPPPRRELPFAAKKAQQAKKPEPPPPVQADEDEETDDDEL